MQTELVFSCSEKNGVYFMFVLLVDFCQTCPISHFMNRNTTAVYIEFFRARLVNYWLFEMCLPLITEIVY
jgi:hypothetical protein